MSRHISNADPLPSWNEGPAQHVLSGQLDKGLDEAPGYGWVLADMKKDWKQVFPS